MSEDESFPDEVELEVARAETEFLEARRQDPEISARAFAPRSPKAARAFWTAIEALGCLEGDVPPARNADLTDAAQGSRSRSPIVAGYTITRELGRGGMGVVYEAQQQDPRRPVALKVVRGGAYVDKQQVKLFQRETQALARLKHPFIASIYEAGRTHDGEHFFAMELVRGRHLREYARHKKLPIRARLELFLRICEAINYAHQRGVIHRDLKPSNILIDGAGNPKILDFGLARVTDADVAVTTTVTEVGKILGTLAYMSPEQARGNPDEIDVRSDVYSLGVLLYQLLTDALPYEVNLATLPDAARVICENPPRKPSTVDRSLRGDLDAIILKALEKEPERRYQGVAGLAEDIERFLTNRPILARAPGTVYLFRKLVAQHKAVFAFVSALFVLIAGFGIWITILYANTAAARDKALSAAKGEAEQRRIAEVERTEAQQTREGVLRFVHLLDTLDAEEQRELLAGRVGSSMLFVERSAQAEGQSDQFGGASRLARRLVENSSLLAARETAEWLYKIQLKDLGDGHPDAVAAMKTYAEVLWAADDLDKAAPLLRELLDMQRRANPNGGPDVEATLIFLAETLMENGDPGNAETLLREGLQSRRRRLPAKDYRIAVAQSRLGECLTDLGRYAEAEPLLTDALDILKAHPGEDDNRTRRARDAVESLYDEWGQANRAGR